LLTTFPRIERERGEGKDQQQLGYHRMPHKNNQFSVKLAGVDLQVAFVWWICDRVATVAKDEKKQVRIK
jgi:hypothetical protein